MAKDEMTSVRMSPDLLAALREHASQAGESLSDVMRRAALEMLGTCPTCGQRRGKPVGPPLDEHGHHPVGDYDMWHLAAHIPAGRERALADLLGDQGIEVYRMWPVRDQHQARAAMDEFEASLSTGKDGSDDRS